MLKTIIGFAALCAFTASAANAATYISTRTVGAATINFSLTTDNTIGVITAGNVTSYAVTISDGSTTINFAPANASLFIFGGALTATATNLNFDFSGANGSFLVFNRGAGLGDHYCFETNGCGGFNNGESYRFGQNGSFTGQAYSGVQTIASVARVVGSVPEPATWVMMLLGFGLIGGTMRHRRAAASVRLAA